MGPRRKDVPCSDGVMRSNSQLVGLTSSITQPMTLWRLSETAKTIDLCNMVAYFGSDKSGFSWLFHQLSTVRSSTAKGSKVSETLPYLVGSSQEFAYVCMLNHHGLPHSF